MKKIIVGLVALVSFSAFASEFKSDLKLVREICSEIYWESNSNTTINGYRCLAKGVDLVDGGTASLEAIVLQSCSAGYDQNHTEYSTRKCLNKGLSSIGSKETEIIKNNCASVYENISAVNCIIAGLKKIQ